MELTKFDVTLAIALLLGVVLMSWLFPTLGLTGEKAQEQDVPDFEVNSSRFDFAGEFPQRPGEPGSEELNWDENGDKYDNQKWLTGDTNGGVNILVINDNTTENPEMRYEMQEWDSGSVVQRDNITFTSEDSRGTISLDTDNDSEVDWDIRIQDLDFRNVNTTDFEALATFTTEERPDKSDFWNPLPDVSGAVVWIGQVIQWVFFSIWEISLNGLGLVYDVASFVIGLVIFISTNYVDVVTADNLHPFANLILVAPLALMYLLWLKFVLVLVDLIWIG